MKVFLAIHMMKIDQLTLMKLVLSFVGVDLLQERVKYLRRALIAGDISFPVPQGHVVILSGRIQVA